MKRILLFALLALASPIVPVQGVGEKGILLYEELRNLTEHNLGSCFRSPDGAECTALCRRVGFRVGRCHRRECFCMGAHCMEPGPGPGPGPSSSTTSSSSAPPTPHTHPTTRHSTHHHHPTSRTTSTTSRTTTSFPDWPTWPDEMTTTPGQGCPGDIGMALCNMGCFSFCRYPPEMRTSSG